MARSGSGDPGGNEALTELHPLGDHGELPVPMPI